MVLCTLQSASNEQESIRDKRVFKHVERRLNPVECMKEAGIIKVSVIVKADTLVLSCSHMPLAVT